MLLLVLGAGTLLRCAGLGVQPLWNDELATWTQARHASAAEVIELGVRPDVHPPGYPLLAHAVVRLRGFDEAALRLPSAIAGSLAILAIFFLGRRLWGRDEGLVASTIVAFGLTPIAYAQEARGYALAFLLAILFCLAWLAQCRVLASHGRTTWRAAGAYVSLGSALVYVHYAALVLVALAGLGLLGWCVAHRRGRRLCIALHLAIALAFAPWLPILFEQLERDLYWQHAPGLGRATLGLVAFFVQDSIAIGAVALLVLIAALLVGRDRAGPRDPDRPAPLAVLMAWWCLPVALLSIHAQLRGSGFVEYAFFIVAPALYLGLARSLCVLARGRIGAPWLTLALAALLVGDLVRHGHFDGTPRKQDFRGVARALAEQEERAPDALLVALTYDEEFFDVYLRAFGADLRVDLLAGAQGEVPEVRSGLADVESLVTERGARHLWFASGHLVPDPEFVAGLHERYRFVERFGFHGAHLVLFEIPESR